MTLASCHKRRDTPFSEKELDFVSYGPDQKQIKFLDSTGTVNTLYQTSYDRSFKEVSGWFTTNEFHETYTVYYQSRDTNTLRRNESLEIIMDGGSPVNPSRMVLYFYNHAFDFNPNVT